MVKQKQLLRRNTNTQKCFYNIEEKTKTIAKIIMIVLINNFLNVTLDIKVTLRYSPGNQCGVI